MTVDETGVDELVVDKTGVDELGINPHSSTIIVSITAAASLASTFSGSTSICPLTTPTKSHSNNHN